MGLIVHLQRKYWKVGFVKLPSCNVRRIVYCRSDVASYPRKPPMERPGNFVMCNVYMYIYMYVTISPMV